MKRKIAALCTGIALVVPLSLAVTAPASATTVTSPAVSQIMVKAAVAPGCVKVHTYRHWGFPTAKVTNKCKTTQRVKVLWAFAEDSSCMTIKAGKSKTDGTGVQGRFDGLRKC